MELELPSAVSDLQTFFLKQAPLFFSRQSLVSASRAGDAAGGVSDAAHFAQIDSGICVDHGYFCV